MKVLIRDIPKEEKMHPDQVIIHLNNLMENFRMKYGDKNVVPFEMAIDAFQKYYSFELDDAIECEECNKFSSVDYKFCPNCGRSLMNNYEN